MSLRPLILSAILTLGLGSACATSTPPPPADAQRPALPSPGDEAALNHFLDDVFEAQVQRDPVRLAYLGRDERQDEWTPIGEARAKEELEFTQRALDALRLSFDPELLPPQARLSYRLFEYRSEQAIASYQWRHHRYPVNQMHGTHSWLPSFLISIHRVGSVEDAKNYIARLKGVPILFAQLEANMVTSQELGILPPAFVFPYAISDCENILKGAPFDDSGSDSTLMADFRKKVMELDIGGAEKDALLEDAAQALKEGVGPAYTSLITLLKAQAALATTDDGAWKFPQGDAYYSYALRKNTTTSLGADEIHALGLREVARIQKEMDAIREAVGFKGDLNAFFDHLRVAPEFYYPQSAEGRQAYLDQVDVVLKEMEAKLPAFFITLPKQGLEVRAVEAYREKSAGKAFYSRGTPDGSRPGRYYANLYDMTAMPTYQLEALAYHEGIPGHHFQNAVAQELGDSIPLFRRQGGYTAYGEGWGLYSEFLAKEMGFYKDPYSDFGRLAMELWRACRLVVDTGIHHLKWTREEAITYLTQNTPNPEWDAIKAIERYIVMPGQATAYKIGQLEILKMRRALEEREGEAFDIRQFHEAILTQGPMPLEILKGEVLGEDVPPPPNSP